MWINLEDIMLGAINQVQSDKYCMISISVESEKVTLTEVESRTVILKAEVWVDSKMSEFVQWAQNFN